MKGLKISLMSQYSFNCDFDCDHWEDTILQQFFEYGGYPDPGHIPFRQRLAGPTGKIEKAALPFCLYCPGDSRHSNPNGDITIAYLSLDIIDEIH